MDNPFKNDLRDSYRTYAVQRLAPRKQQGRYDGLVQDSVSYAAQKGLEVAANVRQDPYGLATDFSLALLKYRLPKNSGLYRIVSAAIDGSGTGAMAGALAAPVFGPASVAAGATSGAVAGAIIQMIQELDFASLKNKPRNATPMDMLRWEYITLASNFINLAKNPQERRDEVDNIYKRMMQIEYVLDQNAPFTSNLYLDGNNSLATMDNDRMWWSINANIDDQLYAGAPSLAPGDVLGGTALPYLTPTDLGFLWEMTGNPDIKSDWNAINANIGIPSIYDRLLQPTAVEKLLYGDAMPTGADWSSPPSDPLLDVSLDHVLTPQAAGIPSWVYRQLAADSAINTSHPKQTINHVNPLGSALSTAHDLFSFSDVLTDVISGRRSDPGAYISLANSVAGGLNWAAGNDGVKDIVSAIGELKDPLDSVSQVTGAAGSAWGLYKNIEGLVSGDFNVKDALGLAVNSYGLTSSAAELTGSSVLKELSGSHFGSIGQYAGGALSAIGLVEGVRGLMTGEAQNPLSVIGTAKNAYDVYALGNSLLGGGEAAGAGGLSTALFGEAGMATAGATAFAGVAMAPLAVIAAGQLLGSLTADHLTPQDARDIIEGNRQWLATVDERPAGLFSGIAGFNPRLANSDDISLRQDVSAPILEMEAMASLAGYSREQVQDLVVGGMGYFGPLALATAHRMGYVGGEVGFMEENRAHYNDPDNLYDRQLAMDQLYGLGQMMGYSGQELNAANEEKHPGWYAQDQMTTLMDTVRELSAVIVSADSEVASLAGDFLALGEQIGLSGEASLPFAENMLALSEQLTQGNIGVDTFAAAVQAIAGGLGLSSQQGAALVQSLLGLLGPLAQGGQAAALMGSGVAGAAEALARAGGAAGDLIGHAAVMPGALGAGGAAAGAAGALIAAGLNPALMDAASQAQMAAQEAAAMAGAIQAIPTEWNSNLYFTRYYTTVGNPFHAGGQVLHDGGLAGATRYHDGGWLDELLKPYEVPAVLKQGEFVVRSESVTAETLPWLQAVNRGGVLPDSGGVTINIQAPLVQVQGGLPQSPDALEDLARLIQDRLIDLAERRYGAGW